LTEHSVNVSYDLGAFEYQRYGVSTTNVTCPVINARWKAYYTLLSASPQALENAEFNVTIFNDTPNPWRTMRHGWWIIFYQVTLLAFAVVNTVFGIRGLLLTKRGRNIATFALALELYCNFRA